MYDHYVACFWRPRRLRNGRHFKGRQQARKLPNPDRGRLLCVFLYGSLCCASALEQSLAVTLRVGVWWSWVLCVASCLSSCPWARSTRRHMCVRRTPATCLTHAGVLRTHTETFLTYPRGHCGVLLPFSSCGVVVTRTCRGRCRLLVEIVMSSCVVMLSSRCCDEGQQDRHVVVLNTTGNHTPLTAHTVNHNKTVLKPPQSHRNHRRAIRKAIGMALVWFGWLLDGSN